MAPASLTPRGGPAPSVKALAHVDLGATVSVSVPPAERGRLALDYTDVQPRNEQAGLYRFGDGASTVTFKACAPGTVTGEQGFPGGFIVAGPQCARIIISANRGRKPLTRQIPFGVPLRSCPADPPALSSPVASAAGRPEDS